MNKRAPRKRRDRKTSFGPTQKDIADALGVSQSTVAMALNPQYENRLLEETADRIRKYAEEVGYHPKRYAQIMQGGQTMVVGIIIRIGPYATGNELILLLANEFNRRGYRVAVIDPMWFDGDADEVKRYLLDQGVEGVVFCNLVNAEEAETFASKLPPNLPIVALQSTLENTPGVRMDLFSAYYDLTRFHLALGLRKLTLLSSFRDPGYITSPAYTLKDRAKGFAQAILEAGGEVVAAPAVAELLDMPSALSKAKHDELVGEIIYAVRDSNVISAQQHAYRQMRLLIESGNIPEALICANDDLAMGALAACVDAGISVPEQVRLSGYDATLTGQFAAVPLTTIRAQPKSLVAGAAAYLISLIEKPEGKPEVAPLSFFDNDIIVRRSSGTEEELLRLKEHGLPKSKSTYIFEWNRDSAPMLPSPV